MWTEHKQYSYVINISLITLHKKVPKRERFITKIFTLSVPM
jgi:hypothetical protein